jgi:hypothetical protein
VQRLAGSRGVVDDRRVRRLAVIPLLLVAACGNSEPAPSGPATVAISWRSVIPESGRVFFEGSVDYVRIQGGIVDREFMLRRKPRRFTVPAGTYRFEAWSRPCEGACFYETNDGVKTLGLDPATNFCHADAELTGVHDVVVTVRGAEGCEITVDQAS